MDIERLTDFVSQKNPDAATRIVLRLFEAVDRLLELPYAGRPSLRPSCRELVTGDYIVIYRVEEPLVKIYRIFHSREDWTDQEIS